MLKQRVLTAIVLAVVILSALFGLPDNLLLLLFGIILLAAAWEWGGLAELGHAPAKVTFLLAESAVMLAGGWMVISHADYVPLLLVSTVLAWLLILYWLVMYERGRLKIHFSSGSRVLLGLLLLPITWLSIAFILIRFENDRLLILLLFFLIWGADVAAYFTGRAFGKHKLAPSISPGKTWQGVMGALAMTVVIACVAWRLMNYPLDLLPKLIVLGLLVAAISIVGDLFESLLKRQVGIKDSSNLLPGHGGVLDRIDSMIAASPLFALGIYLLGLA